MLFLNEKRVTFNQFPNSENYLVLNDLVITAVSTISWVYQDDSEFFKLALLKEHLDEQKITCSLVVSYMPHSRMDRRTGIYAFSLKTASNMINRMAFYTVIIHEPHSDVTPALVDNPIVFDWCKAALDKAIALSRASSLFLPDAGAAKRYSTGKINYGIGNKIRDFKTGEITNYSVTGYVGKRVLIVDDMCSRGGTFIEASIKLKEQGAENVSLLVSYLENNVFTGSIFKHIDKIYCAQANILDKEHDNIILL